MSKTTALPAVLDRALRAATRAPSVHNTQPWRFVVAPPKVELHLDRDRILTVADAYAREARLSCGAALLNLCIAVRAEGHGVGAELLPDPDRPDLLARVRVAGPRDCAPEVRTLATAIERRATNRRPFTEQPVPPQHRLALEWAAETEGARLTLLEDRQALETFTMLMERAGFLQEADPAARSELADWTRRGPGRADGVPATAGGPRPAPTSRLRPRTFPGRCAPEREFEREPLVAVLTTDGDTARDHVRAGQALQRVLLVATAAGLSVSFLSQPVEVPYTRAALRTLLGDRRYPQTVLRIGYGAPAAPTPRRPLTAVTTFAGDATGRPAD